MRDLIPRCETSQGFCGSWPLLAAAQGRFAAGGHRAVPVAARSDRPLRGASLSVVRPRALCPRLRQGRFRRQQSRKSFRPAFRWISVRGPGHRPILGHEDAFMWRGWDRSAARCYFWLSAFSPCSRSFCSLALS